MSNALDSLWEYPLTGIDTNNNNNNKNINCSFSDRNNNPSASEQTPKRNETFDECGKLTEDIEKSLKDTKLSVEQSCNTKEENHKTSNSDQQVPSVKNEEQVYDDGSNKTIPDLELAAGEDVTQTLCQCDQKITNSSTAAKNNEVITSAADNNEKYGSGDIISINITEENISSNLNMSHDCQIKEEKIETLFIKQFDSGSEIEDKQVLSSLTVPLKTMMFTMLDLSSIENRVTHEFIADTSTARSLSIFCYDWLKKYKDYYSFSTYPMHYVYCVLDLSEIYRLHAYFEDNIEM